MLTPEQLHDPTFAFEAGELFAQRYGVTFSPEAAPGAYAEAMFVLNPRTASDALRFELEGRKIIWPAADEELVHTTSDKLGIKEPEYSFPQGAEYDAVLVAGGARNAVPDRAEFVAQALLSGHIRTNRVLVPGDGRLISDKERETTDTWAPGLRDAYGMAEAAVDKLRNDHPELFSEGGIDLRAIHMQTERPDTRAVIHETLLREGIRRGGRLALATTALYVPFKVHMGQATARPLGVEVDVAGVGSRQAVVEARTTDTYFSEVTQTLMSAAHHFAVAKRLNK